MKKFGYFRYITLLSIVFCNSAKAESYTKKTFFSPRTIDINRAMEYTTWHELEYRQVKPKSNTTINSHLALTPFYQQSEESHGLGKYFGIGNGSDSFVIDSFNNTPNSGDSESTKTTEVINSYLIHDFENPNNSTLSGTVSFSPKQEIYGIRLDFIQDINDPIKNIFFKASLPIIQVKQDMGMTTTGNPVTIGATQYSLPDFFHGSIDVTTDQTNLQSPLKKAKINGPQRKTGLADLHLALGYKLYQSTQNHIFFNAGVIVPTSRKQKGEYLFEPSCGNGGHAGLTLGIDGGIELWACKEKKALVRVLASLDYRYLFEATEHRTPQLQSSFFTRTQNSHDGHLNYYYLGGYNGTSVLFPAANVFTQGVKVKPGTQGEALIAISFKCSNLVIDVGYNAFYKDQESVWLKHWNNNSFAIVARDFNTASDTIPTSESVINQRDVQSSDFDRKSIINPSQFSHKVFGGMGYSFYATKKVIPMIGMGASYEYASNNATMEAVALWIKGGVSF